MKLRDTYIYTVPGWSLSYLINGDDSRYTDRESKMIKKFTEQVNKDTGTINWQWGIYTNIGFIPNNDIDDKADDCYDIECIVFCD